MGSNHRLVLFTHALCRLSYPATLRTTAPGFKSGLFRDRARRSERSSWALPSSSPLRSHRPDPCSPGPSQSIDSPPLPRKRSSRGEGRCRLVGGNTRYSALCRSPVPRRATHRRAYGSRPTVTFLAGMWTPERRIGTEWGCRFPKGSLAHSGLAASHQILEASAALANVRVLVEISVVEERLNAYEPHSLAAMSARGRMPGGRR